MFRFDGLRGMLRWTYVLLLAANTFISMSEPVSAAGLTLPELMREALAHNHDLGAARAQVEAAMGRLTQAGLRPNPRLNLGNESDQIFGNEGEYSRSIGVTQDFPITGRLARARDVARVDVARALTEVNEAERRLLGDIATAYYAVIALDQRIAVRERLIRIDQSLVTVSAERQKAGEVSELDVNTATLELERLRQERTVLTGERAAALKTLAGIVGYAAQATPEINTTVPEVAAPPPLAQLTEQALSRRTDLRLLALAADRAQAEAVLAQASAWEDWGVSLGIRQDKLVVGNPVAPSVNKALMLSLSIPLPLFNRNQGNRTAAVAEERTAREQSLALQLRIGNEVAALHEQLTRLLTALNSYTEHTLPLSRRNTELARDAYRSGQLSITDVVQAERQENDLNAGYADALGQYLRTLAELNAATVGYAPLMTHPLGGSADEPGER
jgi:cobalt-zinc-cadmium efflux system outer membrane protein